MVYGDFNKAFIFNSPLIIFQTFLLYLIFFLYYLSLFIIGNCQTVVLNLIWNPFTILRTGRIGKGKSTLDLTGVWIICRPEYGGKGNRWWLTRFLSVVWPSPGCGTTRSIVNLSDRDLKLENGLTDDEEPRETTERRSRGGDL